MAWILIHLPHNNCSMTLKDYSNTINKSQSFSMTFRIALLRLSLYMYNVLRWDTIRKIHLLSSFSSWQQWNPRNRQCKPSIWVETIEQYKIMFLSYSVQKMPNWEIFTNMSRISAKEHLVLIVMLCCCLNLR